MNAFAAGFLGGIVAILLIVLVIYAYIRSHPNLIGNAVTSIAKNNITSFLDRFAGG